MKTHAWLLPSVIAVLVLLGWLWFYYQPQQQAIGRLHGQMSTLLAQQARLEAEMIAVRDVDAAIPIPEVAAIRDAWATVARVLEGAGFTVERVEIGVPRPQGEAGPGVAPVAPPGPGVAPVAPPGPGVAPVAPPGPGVAPVAPPGPGVAPVAPPVPRVVIVEARVEVRFVGDYMALARAIQRVVAEMPAAGWKRLSLEGRGDGKVTVTADVRMLAMEGAP